MAVTMIERIEDVEQEEEIQTLTGWSEDQIQDYLDYQRRVDTMSFREAEVGLEWDYG